MGKLVPWMEVPPSRRPRILLVWWLCPRVLGVEIFHKRLRNMPFMVGIRLMELCIHVMHIIPIIHII